MAKLIPVVGDFETYWSVTHSLTKMNPIAYVMDPETEIISLALKVGRGDTSVLFGEDAIREHLNTIDWSDKLLVAHNMSGFDSMIFRWRFGIKPAMWGCTLAMARPHHMLDVGGSLAKLVEHYKLGVKDASALNATKGKHLKDFTPEELMAMAEYNKADTEQCFELFKILLAKTPPKEMKLIDQTVRMLVEPQFECDVDLLETSLAEERWRKKEALMKIAKTIGAVSIDPDDAAEEARRLLASSQKFAAFLIEQGVSPPMKISKTTGKETYALAKTDEEFIQLQEHDDPMVAAAAIARLGVKSTILESRIETFLEVSEAVGGRLPVATNYYAAHTGRTGGAMKMNQGNLPRVGKDKAGKPKATNALRCSMRAPKGKKVIVADLSGIELRMNMFLWKVPYAMSLFQADPEKADLYRYFAAHELYDCEESAITKDQRQLGKICVAENTLLLCKHDGRAFWIPIQDFKPEYQLWDGEEWVWAKGVVSNGLRPTQKLCGISLTPDHLVLCGATWKEARHVVGDTVAQALATGAENLPLWGMLSVLRRGLRRSSLSAIAGFLSTRWKLTTSKLLSQPDAIFAPLNPVRALGSYIGGTPTSYQTTNTESDCSTDCRPRLVGATRRQTSSSTTMGVEESTLAKSGGRIVERFSNMLSLLQDGITQSLRWIAPTSTAGTSRVICASYPGEKTCSTNEKYQNSNAESRSLNSNSPVYDILNCGPRNRFTVLSDSGPIVVHNCHLGLGYGAGAGAFRNVAKMMGGLDIELDYAKQVVKAYRDGHPEIAGKHGGWQLCNAAIENIYAGNEVQIDPWGLCHTAKDMIITPQGALRYPNLRQEFSEDDGKAQWVYGEGRNKSKIYGGRMVENCIQHLSRFVLTDAQLQFEKDTGFPVAHTVYDEIVAVVPDKDAEQALAHLQELLRTPPKWFPELVTWSEGDIADSYGEAK